MKAKNIRNLPTTNDIPEDGSVLIARDGGIFRMLMRNFRKYIAYASGADVLGVPVPTAADTGKVPVVNDAGNAFDLKHVANTFLLWKNPDPSADFAAQTISCDTAGYIILAVVFKFHKDKNERETVAFPNDGNTASLYAVSVSGTTISSARRDVTASAAGIVFGNGSMDEYTGNAPPTAAAYAVPLAVYGIR